MNVKEEIMYYIEHKEINGALMITGKWGCGKTYFINKFIEKIDPPNYCCIMISLFGIGSVDELNTEIKRIFTRMRFEKKQKRNKDLKKKAQEILSGFEEYSKAIKGIKAVLSINPYDFIDIKSEMNYCCGMNGETINKNYYSFGSGSH